MREPVRRIAVGREQEHAFGEVVEPADIGEARDVRHEVEHRASALADRTRRHHARRFVEHEPRRVRASARRCGLPSTAMTSRVGIDGLADAARRRR